MNRTNVLVKRNLKEILRDPISLIFTLGLPAVMLIVFQLIFGNMDETGATMFQINNFAPAIATFGFTFTMLYMALMIAGDKGGAFMARLTVSPMKQSEYYLSFVIATFPVAIAQTLIFYIIALIFGLELSLGILVSLLYLMPSALFYCSCGILIGSVSSSEKQAGPMSSLIITSAGILGGVWMPIEAIGGGFVKFCKCLPFYNGVQMAQAAVVGDYAGIFPCIFWVLGYTVVVFGVALLVFKLQQKRK